MGKVRNSPAPKFGGSKFVDTANKKFGKFTKRMPRKQVKK